MLSERFRQGLSPSGLDAVFTDPAYFGSVQYAELMDSCYVWLRKLAGENMMGFDRPSTCRVGELTANENMPPHSTPTTLQPIDNQDGIYIRNCDDGRTRRSASLRNGNFRTLL